MNLPFSSRLKIGPDALMALAVALGPLLYFSPAVRGRLFLAPDDGIIFNVPLRVAAANIMRGGNLPLWNPYIFCGMPLHGSAQAGVLFPLNWFYLFFNAPAATNLMMLSAYVTAALGAYFYARRSGASIMGSALTSLIWQCCGFMVGQVSHANIVQTAALLPWLLWAIDGYGTQGKRRTGVALAIIVAVQAFAGHPQTFAYSLLLATVYAAVMWRASRRAPNWYLWTLLLLAAGVILSAVQILPTYELMRNSLRADESYDFISSFSLPARFLITLLAPYGLGGGSGVLFRAPYVSEAFYAEYIGYVGVGSLMLAAMAVVVKRDARTKFWAVVAIVALGLALGRNLPFKLYGIIYYIPLLNLFRVPARHMMEMDFALAVLAGRGLTAIAMQRDRKKTLVSATVGLVLVVLTGLVVTVGRPPHFHLARQTPVTLLRAPELFLPLVMAILSACALWRYSRRPKTSALLLMMAVIVIDLIMWGQFSGWREASPKPDFELWSKPDTVRLLEQHRLEQRDNAPFRILTEDQPFDPDVPVPQPSPGRAWVAALQPDIYMMHGIENAAGYDGFGLARYSQMAGDMKIWGELSDAERTLRGDSRELDLLNVRYLLTSPLEGEVGFAPASGSASSTTQAARRESTVARDVPAATRILGDQPFAAEDLKLPTLNAGARLIFRIPLIEAESIALLTNLSWSLNLTDGTPVGHLSLKAQNGRTFEFDLLVGEHTSEWAYDRSDVRSRIRNKRAKVGTSYRVKDAEGSYQGHTYVSTFKLPERSVITEGELTVAPVADAPDLRLGVFRISLVDGKKSFPIPMEWVSREAANSEGPAASEDLSGVRWQRLAKLQKVAVYENERALPRAWLTSGVRLLKETEILQVIRSGRLPDGTRWEPRRVALIEEPVELKNDTSPNTENAQATVTKHEPNRVELQTASARSSVLVLADNYFPGWRAYIDGRSAKMLRVNYNQRGVMLSPGEHVVEFVYRPLSVAVGLLVSLLTLTALILWSAHLLPESQFRWLNPRLRKQQK